MNDKKLRRIYKRCGIKRNMPVAEAIRLLINNGVIKRDVNEIASVRGISVNKVFNG